MYTDRLQKHIKEWLVTITNQCEFKKSFIPKGWACVNIEKFSKEMAEEIAKMKDCRDCAKRMTGCKLYPPDCDYVPAEMPGKGSHVHLKHQN